MRILIISNHEVTIYYFRCELIKRLIDDGNEIYISQPYGKHKEFFESLGCKCIDTKITQYGMNPFKEISLVNCYVGIMRKVKPDVVVTYTIKPNLYGGMAAQIAGIPYISTVTGIGGAFEKGAVFKAFTVLLYRIATKRISTMFFQNEDASALFEGYKIAKGRHKIVNGSGVNLGKHSFVDYPADDGTTKLLYIGRIMNDKGVRELFEAVKKLKKIGKPVLLEAVGWCEDECKELLENAVSDGTVVYHGWQEDVRPYIEKCNAVILPSYHEGMANVLLESQASGRPVLASNIHGCIETFENGVTGWSFEPRNVQSVVDSIVGFIEMPYEKKIISGKLARARMEELFDRNTVVEKYVNEIYSIGGNKNGTL